MAILRRARRPMQRLHRHNRNATGRSIATSATIAIAAAAAIAIETATVGIATAIATFGATVRGIRAAMDVHAATILETIAVNPTRAGPSRGNRNATPAPSAAKRLDRNKRPVKIKDPAKIKAPVKTRRLA